MSVRRKVVVAFNLEVSDERWASLVDEDDILYDLADYFASRVGNDNKAGDGFYLTEPAVYWPEGFVADVDEGAFKEEWEDETPARVVDDRPAVVCSICTCDTPAETAHLHQGKWVGEECCWTEQLRGSE